MDNIMKHIPQMLNEDQSNITSWSQLEDYNEIEIPTQKQLTTKYFDNLDLVIMDTLKEDRLGKAWILENKFKESGIYLLPPLSNSIDQLQYKAMLQLRLLMIPTIYNSNINKSSNERAFQCPKCNQVSGNISELGYQIELKHRQTFDELDLRFHCMNCRKSNLKHLRHSCIQKELLTLFKNYKMKFSGETAVGDDDEANRLDATVNITCDTKYYIDITVKNPASKTYVIQRHTDTIPLAAAKLGVQEKLKKYTPILAQHNPPISENQFVPFVIETTGKLSDEAEEFLTKVKDHATVPDHIKQFYMKQFRTHLQKIIAVGNAQAYVQFHNNIEIVNKQ